MKNYIKFLAVILLFFSALAYASFGNKSPIEKFLIEFHQNPALVMDRLPAEILPNGQVIERGQINALAMDRSGFFGERDEVRRQIIENSAPHVQAVPTSNDQAELLVENGDIQRNIFELHAWKAARLMQYPWSDSYWPMYKGLIGVRYSDPAFPDSKKWIENFEYILSHPASSVIASGIPSEVDRLSPAEKYDFVVGDTEGRLAQFAWNQGKKYYDKGGIVAGWMGICHGWSAAAHMNATIPERIVMASAPDGRSVSFYPSDIRALQSMLWANGPPATRFVGNRCKIVNPPKDQFGRMLDSGCFDTNPATWHLALLNQIGRHQRSFVMDATYDDEVWNFAMARYQVSYFNPQDLRTRYEVQQAIVPIEKYTLDKFRTYRAPETRYVIGIALDATYVNMSSPSRNLAPPSPFKTVRYMYDLELDASYQIIGGEWYTNAHPDFIWTFALGSQARAVGDLQIDPSVFWDIHAPIPADWTSFAQKSSSRGQPLYSVIRSLIQ